jgi:(1->4)-alpha-D-glucan 1-alpha-D-glucosylmutase
MHTSTYRLQVNGAFSLEDAARLVPYLKELGVGAVYLSPVFAATPGSTHGYDVCDPTRVNPEAGGEAGLETLARALQENGLGCILDIVPNHMAADSRHNLWWRDVLALGPDSPYAPFFDIDWHPRKVGLHGKVLLPVLESSYGETLTAGELHLEKRGGELAVVYRDLDFPVSAASTRKALEQTPGETVAEKIRALNGVAGEAGSFDGLHALLEAQFYRLSHWRTALHEANYRRFFDVSTLLGIRVERPEVFEAVHARLRDFARAGFLTGVRVDHVDGLRDPAAYLVRLRELLRDAAPEREPYLVVEKILQDEEELAPDWAVEGTTGYEFLSDLNGLFVESRGLGKLRNIAKGFIGGKNDASQDAEETRIACKRLVLSLLMRSELNLLADQLDRLSEADRGARDFTRDDLRRAIGDTMACLTVYRTYGCDGRISPFDARAFEAARRNPSTDPSVFRFLRKVFFSFEETGTDPLPAIPRPGRLAFALRLQQSTGSVTAKGVEDTAFYRLPALLSLNEVGSSPASRGGTAARFHARMQARRGHFPHAMLATSTHDTKRGEDARARLNILAAHPEKWRVALNNLGRELSEPRQRAGLLPSDELFLYQTLLGSWPVTAKGRPAPAGDEFRERLETVWIKATRESKLQTNWVRPDEGYEGGLRDFLAYLLMGPGRITLEKFLLPLLETCAREGARFALAQLACKCAAPGIPDIYQGSEFWDLSMVDPDNRRPVDFEARQTSLSDMTKWLDPDADPSGRLEWARKRWEEWPDGRVKQYVLARCLRWRARYPEVFLEGDYTPVEATGKSRAGALAFLRSFGETELLVAIPLRAKAHGVAGQLLLPDDWADVPVRHLFTGSEFIPAKRGKVTGLDLAPLLAEFPVAWLWKSPAGDARPYTP